MAGCKCPGSCACKIKKPRKLIVRKAVVGGRVKQPQIVIQGMPPVSTTAIPQGYPYLTVTSDAAAKRSMATQMETQAKKETKEMGTETEPLLVTTAKGKLEDIFSIMKAQEATGKVLSLTGAGRPPRSFNDSLILATPSPSPAPAPVAPSAIASALDAFAPSRSKQSTLKSFFKKEPK
jgi:hypothetical protein